jgi:hypothetical protein
VLSINIFRHFEAKDTLIATLTRARPERMVFSIVNVRAHVIRDPSVNMIIYHMVLI